MSSRKAILGFAAQERKFHEGDWFDTFIGGRPLWPPDLEFIIPPCPLCQNHRQLVLQAFAPHRQHLQRVIYLFGCNSMRCALQSDSWMSLRVSKNAPEQENSDAPKHHEAFSEETQRESENMDGQQRQDISWDTDTESDSNESDDADILNDLKSLSLQVERARATPKASSFRKAETTVSSSRGNMSRNLPGSDMSRSTEICDEWCLRSYFVEVAEEPERIETADNDGEVKRLLEKYEKEESERAGSGASESWGAEVAEKDHAASENHDLFHERISRAPEQVLRYSFEGTPIWAKYPPPQLASTKCSCGSSLAFELQVLGSSLHYLQPDKSVRPPSREAGMNFASVAVYTCAADCIQSEKLADSHSFKIFKQLVVVQQDDW